MDFSIFYKEPLSSDLSWASSQPWTHFISTFNSSDRVQQVFSAVNTNNKYWLIAPEYGYESSEIPSENCYVSSLRNESEYICNFANNINFAEVSSLCIDSTGFLRTHLLFLVLYLFEKGISKVDVLYSEPVRYSKKEETVFSCDGIEGVRQIAGYEGTHHTNARRTALIIGSGYDSDLIRSVAEHKSYSRKTQLIGLPSLRADMLQENLYRAYAAEEALGDYNTLFAPAHDPFITANVLSGAAERLDLSNGETNLYLSPISTKAQTLGFALFFFSLPKPTPVSIIFPVSKGYDKETSKGISRIWKYTLDFSAIRNS